MSAPVSASVSAPVSAPVSPTFGPAPTLRDITLPHGITLACREMGQFGPLGQPEPDPALHRPRVLLLHGFPEAAFIWDELMGLLAAGPARAACLAPNLRGYPGSSRPTEVEAYRAKYITADLVALIEGQGGAVDALVAHDWGGAVAWSLAALRPDLVKRLVIINSPHPATFLRELRDNPAQQAASAYMNFLCRPDAERLLSERDHARLWPFLEGWADGMPWLTPALREAYRACWAAGLTGPLNYYRASPLRPASGPGDALHRLQLPDALVNVTVPTTVVWGERDRALLPALLDGLSHWVPRLRVVRLPDASHWVVHEQPARVAQEIERSLAA